MTTEPTSTLVLPSHGTGNRHGQEAIRRLVQAVADRVEAPVVECFVDVQQPDVPSTLTKLPGGGPVIIAPLLLSTGYHVRVDIAEAARALEPRATVTTSALGPDDRLVSILAARLRQAGLVDADRVVLAAAGSSDPDAVADCRVMVARLAELLGRHVAIGFLASAQPDLGAAIDAVRAEHPGSRVAVATYLLAPGHFARLAAESSADIVSEPLLQVGTAPDEALVDLIVDRFRTARSELTD